MASWARAEARLFSGALACALHGATLLLLLFLTAVPLPPQLSPAPLEVTFLPAPEPPLDLRPEPAPGREEKAGAAASPAPRSEVQAIAPTAAPSPIITARVPLPSGSFGPSDTDTGPGTGAAGRGAGGEGAGGRSGEGLRPPAGHAMVGPDWITRPTDAQMRTYFPRAAIERRTGGVAWLGCQVDAGNRARRCRILGERPAGLGFGAAGLRLSRLFRIRPPQRDGRDQYDAWVRVPIYFDIE